MNKHIEKTGVILVVLLGLFSTSINAAQVKLQLSLLVDVSGSVDATEYDLQMQGYASAFRNTAVIDAITGGASGTDSIAVNMVQWSSEGSQSEVVGWTLLSDAASSTNFGDVLGSTDRAFGGSTAPQSALVFGTDLFANNGFDSSRSLIDISGDGERNGGLGGSEGRDYALNNGIDTINGIVIGGGSSVADYYRSFVIGGADNFLVETQDFEGFASAINDKLLREVGGEEVVGEVGEVPIPGAVWLFGTGILGLIRLNKKTK